MKKFFMLLKIAFRNVFRYIRRNIVISTLIFFCSFNMVCFFAFQQESYKNISNSMIDILMGHVVIISSDSKASEYLSDERNWENLKPINEDKKTIDRILNSTADVEAFSNRTRFGAILQKGDQRNISFVIGITPDREYQVTKRIKVEKGKRLSDTSVNDVLLTVGVAKKLKAKIGDKITLFADSSDGRTTQKEFVLRGIVSLKGLDKYELDFVYIHNKAALELLNYKKNTVTEYVVRVKNRDHLGAFKKSIEKEFDKKGIKAQVFTWYELGGLPSAIIDITKFILIATMVIAFAVIFLFITNTILTLVLERRKEIGTLRAIGFQKKDIVLAFLLEIGIINAFFCLLGIIFGCLTVYIMGKTSGAPQVSEAMEYIFGGKSMHPALVWYNPVITYITFSVVTFLAAILPALKASSMQPIEAIER